MPGPRPGSVQSNEPLKNSLSVAFRDTLPVVANTKHNATVRSRERDAEMRRTFRMRQDIIEQIGDALLQEASVAEHLCPS